MPESKPFLIMDIATPYVVTWYQMNTREIRCCVYNGLTPEEERKVAVANAICSQSDADSGMYSQEFGLKLSLKRAMKAAKLEGMMPNKEDRKRIFDAFVFMVNTSRTITPIKVRPKFPTSLEGHEFMYDKKKYLVVGKVWGKAPKKVYHKVMGGRVIHPWVEYVVFEDYQGERYTLPLSEFTSKSTPI